MADAADCFELENYVVKKAPPRAFYIPNFISEEEEKFLLDQVNGAPKPKWTKLSGRRLQNWGGLPHPKGMVLEKLPRWLEKYTTQVGSLPVFNTVTPNHVLVNEYEPGQGIMVRKREPGNKPHEDGPLFYPVVSTINLGSHTFLDFYHPLKKASEKTEENASSSMLNERYFMSLLLEPRSLFLLTGDLYHNYLHGIAERTYDVVTDKVANLDACNNATLGDILQRNTRISLTIRNVPKILKFKINLGR